MHGFGLDRIPITFNVLRIALRCTIDQSTARIIATALIRSKLDKCNSLLSNLLATHTNPLHFTMNSAARAVTRTSKFLRIQ
jgi:hypothetical protein